MKQHQVGNVLFGFDKEISLWVAERIPDFQPSQTAVSLGIVKDGDIVAGIVFENWNGVNIEASIAADDKAWANRETLFSVFHYPFNQLGCEAVTVLVASTNLKSLNLATKLGFEPEAMIKYAARDGSALIVLKMMKNNCKWIKCRGSDENHFSSQPLSVIE